MSSLDLMPGVPTYRAVWSGLAWLAMVAMWFRTCLWVDNDARTEFDSALPWSTLLVVWGPCLLACPFFFGWGGSAVSLLVPCLVTASYVWHRDVRVSADDRIAVSPHMELMMRSVGRFGPMLEAVAAIGAARDRGAPVVTVTCPDSDDTPANPHRRPRRRKAIARAAKTARPVFAKAFVSRARAVRIEPQAGGKVDVRYQIDGVFNRMKTLHQPDGALLVSALKTLAGMKSDDPMRPQAGTFSIDLAAEHRTVEASTHPSQFGQTIDLRLRGEPLAAGQYRSGLAAIGLPWRDCEAMHKAVAHQRGMIVISGPAHSGRTTTAYATISEISPLARSVVTIEKPIEERLPFAIQSPVAPEAYRTFPTVLRAVLLQNPDVIFVGEIRDRETAEIAMQAAADRLIITTTTANDAASSLIGLLQLGVDAAFVCESVRAVLAQRLARKLCAFCKKPYPPPPDFRRKLGPLATHDIVIYRRGRCDACHRIGFSGLLPITEFLTMDDAIRDLLGSRTMSRRVRKQARQAGMRTLRESAIELVRNGATSISEVVRVVP